MIFLEDVFFGLDWIEKNNDTITCLIELGELFITFFVEFIQFFNQSFELFLIIRI